MTGPRRWIPVALGLLMLAAVLPVEAVTVSGGTIMVGTSDVVENQDASGYDYRMQYSLLDDKYAQNGNISSPVLTGWASGVYAYTNIARVTNWDGAMYLGRASNTSADPGGQFGSVTWKFDFSGTGKTISNLQVTALTSVWYDNYPTSARWYVSTDGVNWHLFCEAKSSSSQTVVGVAPYYDVTGYVQGSNVYYLRADLDPYWVSNTVELFRDQAYGGFDNKVWLLAPLPEIDADLAKLGTEGRVIDYLKVRRNLIDYFSRVATMATANGYTDIAARADSYVTSASSALMSDVYNIASKPQYSIPRPNMLAPWTIASGNLLVGGVPVNASGFIWTYSAKDNDFGLFDFGLNLDNLEIGPHRMLADGYQLLPDLRAAPYVVDQRNNLTVGASRGEPADDLLGPHYLPGWFSTWAQQNGVADEYAWMDTDEGRQLLDLLYQGHYIAFNDIGNIKTADLANEWTFWSAGSAALTEFRGWLSARHGTISVLNSKWGTTYSSFSDVPIPDHTVASTPTGVYTKRAALWDWCCYNTSRASTVVSWMNSTFKQRYPGPLTHMKCVFSAAKYIRNLNTSFIRGVDPQKIVTQTDLIGTDGSFVRETYWKNTLWRYDYLKSICPNKPIFCSEMHAVPFTDSTASGEIRRGMFQRFVHGERLNLLFLNTKLTVPEWWNQAEGYYHWTIGEFPSAMDSFCITSADLRRLVDPINSFASRPADVLIFYDNAADFGVPGTAAAGAYEDRVLDVYESLLYRDVKVGVVTEGMLAQQIPGQKLLILAGANYVSDNTVSRLRSYINSGGRIVWIGSNFGYDEYGAARSFSSYSDIYNSANVYRKSVSSASTYSTYWPALFAAAGISTPFSANSGGAPAWGVEIRSFTKPNGNSLVFLANANNSEVTFQLQGPSAIAHLTDLVTGASVDPAGVHMAANGVLLLSTAHYNLGGHVTLGDYSGTITAVPVVVDLRKSTGVTTSKVVSLDSGGNYSLSIPEDGTYDAAIKASHWLRSVVPGLSVNADVTGVDAALVNGDCDGSNKIDAFDVIRMRTALSGATDPACDLNGDGTVATSDRTILRANHGRVGAK